MLKSVQVIVQVIVVVLTYARNNEGYNNDFITKLNEVFFLTTALINWSKVLVYLLTEIRVFATASTGQIYLLALEFLFNKSNSKICAMRPTNLI